MKLVRLASLSPLALAMAFAACAQTPKTPTQPAADRIEATTFSWGRMTDSWSIRRGGDGKHLSVRDPYADKPNQKSEAFAVSPEAFDAIARKLAAAQAYAGDDSKCKLMVTDGPYGTISWFKGDTKVHEFRWQAGYACPGKDAALDAMDAGRQAVMALAGKP